MKINTNHKKNLSKNLSNKISDVKSKVSDTIKKYEDNFTKKPDSEELKNPQETPDYIFAGWMNADKIKIVKKYIESQDESQGDTPTLFKVNRDKLEKIRIDEDDEEAFKFIAKNLITKKYVYRKKNTDNNVIINKGKDLLDKGNNILKKRTDKIVYVIPYNTGYEKRLNEKYDEAKYYLRVGNDYYVSENIREKYRRKTIDDKNDLNEIDREFDDKNNELTNLKYELERSKNNISITNNDTSFTNSFYMPGEYCEIFPYISKLYEKDDKEFKYKYNLSIENDVKILAKDIDKYEKNYNDYNNYGEKLKDSLKKIRETLAEKSEINKRRKEEQEKEDLKALGNLTFNLTSFGTKLTSELTAYTSNTILSSIKTIFKTRFNDVITGFIIIIFIVVMIFGIKSKKSQNKKANNSQQGVAAEGAEDSRNEDNEDIFTSLTNIPNNLSKALNTIYDTYNMMIDMFEQGERLSEDLANTFTPQITNTIQREIYNDGRCDNIYYYKDGEKSTSTFVPKELKFKTNSAEYTIKHTTENVEDASKFVLDCNDIDGRDDIDDGHNIVDNNCEIKIYTDSSANSSENKIYTDYDKIKIKE